MTQKEFIEILKKEEIDFFVNEGEIVISNKNSGVNLELLTIIPENVRFENRGYVDLSSLTTISKGTIFDNNGNVWLNSKTSSITKNSIFKQKQREGVLIVSYHKSTIGFRTTTEDMHGIKMKFIFN